jgi:adenylate cyclase
MTTSRLKTLTVYRDAIIAMIERYRGRLVDFTGDNLLATFASTVDAVECASVLQADLAKRMRSWPTAGAWRSDSV